MRVVASVLLANVMLPHVPAAILLGGYATGVVTAVVLNLLLNLWILRRDGNRESLTSVNSGASRPQSDPEQPFRRYEFQP